MTRTRLLGRQDRGAKEAERESKRSWASEEGGQQVLEVRARARPRQELEHIHITAQAGTWPPAGFHPHHTPASSQPSMPPHPARYQCPSVARGNLQAGASQLPPPPAPGGRGCAARPCCPGRSWPLPGGPGGPRAAQRVRVRWGAPSCTEG